MHQVDFALKRRQRLISEPYFKWLSQFHVEAIDEWSRILPANGAAEQKQATAAAMRASGRFELLMLERSSHDREHNHRRTP